MVVKKKNEQAKEVKEVKAEYLIDGKSIVNMCRVIVEAGRKGLFDTQHSYKNELTVLPITVGVDDLSLKSYYIYNGNRYEFNADEVYEYKDIKPILNVLFYNLGYIKW